MFFESNPYSEHIFSESTNELELIGVYNIYNISEKEVQTKGKSLPIVITYVPVYKIDQRIVSENLVKPFLFSFKETPGEPNAFILDKRQKLLYPIYVKDIADITDIELETIDFDEKRFLSQQRLKTNKQRQQEKTIRYKEALDTINKYSRFPTRRTLDDKKSSNEPKAKKKFSKKKYKKRSILRY